MIHENPASHLHTVLPLLLKIALLIVKLILPTPSLILRVFFPLLHVVYVWFGSLSGPQIGRVQNAVSERNGRFVEVR